MGEQIKNRAASGSPTEFLRRVRRWAEEHAYGLFLTMLVLTVCELMVLSAVSR